ncbi:MAG: hypothetical protein QGG40_09140, partial [Myxococcota bacterium]|nr:hypothetical protein [Myxococcota bacterium]
FWKLKKEAEKNDLDPGDVLLPPIIEFDAIFIPDSYSRVPLVASSLAYEEFPVGGFKPKRDDIPLILLGLSAWNHPDLGANGGLPVRDSLFVDAFLATLPSPAIESFVAEYQAEFSRTPGVVDAIIHDATRLLAAAVDIGESDRKAIRDLLPTVELTHPVAGGSRFAPDREVDWQLLALTVDEEGIRPAGLEEEQAEPGDPPVE